MPRPETFEGMAAAGAAEYYDLMMPGLSHAIAALVAQREQTHDAGIRIGFGLAIDRLRAEVKAL